MSRVIQMLHQRSMLFALVPLLVAGAATAATDDAKPLAPPPAFKYVPQKLTVASRRATAQLYVRTCAACHGRDGDGNNNGLSLFGSKDPQHNAMAMHFGRAQPPPLTIVMPAYGADELLTQKEIAQLGAYIAEFRPQWP